ncbi:MAG: hypothetical protein BroJett029_10210 [Alphaproteobacteria bacterium]|nr:MAG: hypothetical protein BroJett029_10210 [Alphaproteobacteria bacterium]
MCSEESYRAVPKLRNAIAVLRDYVQSQREQAARQNSQKFWERDMKFVERIFTLSRSNTSHDLVTLLDEMRGTSQGFGSYAGDLARLDELLDDVVAATEQAILASRTS